MDRKRFPIEDYPLIQKYIGDRIDESFMQYPYRLLDDEDMASVIEEWIKYYEEKIDRTVENTHTLFEIASGSLGGHEVISEMWNFTGKRPNTFTKEQIRESYFNNFRAAICHLFQKFGDFAGKKSDRRVYNYDKEHSGGATGLGIYVRWSLRFYESDLKSVKANCVTDFSFGVNATCSKRSEHDIHQ